MLTNLARQRRTSVECLVGLLFLLGSTICGTGAYGQFQARAVTEDLFLTAPRSLQRLLAEGRSAIADGRYAEGIGALGAILQDDDQTLPEDLRGRDFFLGRATNGIYAQSLKGEVIRELNKLSPEARQILEVQFGVQARQLLDAGVAAGDLVAIASVARRFVHTQAGYDAMVLLAQFNLSHGFPLAAADTLQSLLDYPAARERYGVRLAFHAALAWQQSGKTSRAEKTLELAGRDFAGQSLQLAGRQIPIENVGEIIKVIGNDGQTGITDNSTPDWLTTGGSAARNATSKIGLPLPNERWEWFIHSSRPEGQALREAEETMRKAGAVLLPKLELRALDNTIVCRNNDATIVGLDFESGLLVWRRPSSAGVAPLKRGAWESGDQSLSTDLLSRVWGATSFGRITCDAHRCYHVVHLQDEMESTRGMGGMMSLATSRLEGISLARQGAILWSIGGSDSDEPQLSTAFFLGPPLPYAGQLYSIVENNGETELVVLDPETGKLQWRQQLASAAMMPIGLDRARQSQALTPSIADGVIICPTGVGGIVAIDLLTRSLRWGATYAVRGAMGNFNSPLLGQDYQPLQSRWFDEGLIIENGLVVFTPPESDLVVCYDLLTGEKLLERKRGNACYAAGVDSNNLIIVGPDRTVAYDIRKREPRWEVAYPDGLTLAGRGIWQDGQLMLPLTGQRVIELDLRQGKISGASTVAQPLGNLFAHRGQLLSIGPSSVVAYYTREALEQQIEQRLAQNPQDVWGLNYRSQLLLSQGDTLAALQQLLDAYAVNPEDDETRYFLADAMLTGLQHDFEQFAAYAEQLDRVLLTAPQRMRYLQLLAQGLSRRGDFPAAFKRLWEIMREQQSAYIAGVLSRSDRIELSWQHWVNLDTWLATELARCYQSCNDQQRQEVQSLIDAEIGRIRGTVLPVRRQLLRNMAQLPMTDNDNLELARALLNRGEQTQAEQLLCWLARSQDADSRRSALELLGLKNQYDQALVRSPSGDFTNSDWRTGVVQRDVERVDTAIYSVGRPIEMIARRFGRPPVAIGVSEGALALSDVDGNPLVNLVYRAATSDLTGNFMTAELRGGLLLLETMSELMAFDIYRGFQRSPGQALLWRSSLDTAGPQEAFQPAQMMVSADEPLGIQTRRRKGDGRKYVELGPWLATVKIMQNGQSVIGLDPYTGRQLWSRDGYSDQVRFAGHWESDQLAVVNPANGKTDVLDARDGTLLRQSEFLVGEMHQRLLDDRLGRWNAWFDSGNWLVDYRSDDASSRVWLRVWNPLTETVLLESKLPKSARATHCDRRLLVVLEPPESLVVVDLESGTVQRHQVPIERDLASVGVMRFADQWVVISSRNALSQRVHLGQPELQANGSLYALNADDLQLSWNQPGRLMNFAIPLQQPRNSPFLVAYRFAAQQEAPMSAALVLLDLRSGQLAQVVDGLNVSGRTFGMRLRPEEQQIVVAVGEQNLRFHVTDQPPPPEPVAHFGGVYEKPRIIKRDEATLFK
ncbi:MAG: PQQ-binding-like beta-propeller repeat protein [Pirellulaceae bacterium]|nr:PQQ-binding-like beta-propeller repeat protein [Pirellulaceae bacterium]